MKRYALIAALLLMAGSAWAKGPKVVSLKPNITEIIFALGAGDRLLGVTTWCDHPPEASKLPKIGDYISINTEKVIALHPDMAIGSKENSLKEPYSVLNRAGIRTLVLGFNNIDETYGSIAEIARALGREESGKKLITKMKRDLKTSSGASGKSALMIVGRRPLVAAGGSTFFNEILELAGGRNIVTGKTTYPTINTEFILAKRPDVVIDLSMGTDTEWELPLKLNVVRLDISAFRAGPRLPEAVQRLKEALK